MPLQPYQKTILELFKEQELLMAQVYERFARAYHKYGDRYRALVAEELEHAGWVEHLGAACLNEKARFAEGKTRTYTIKAMISYLKDLIARLDRERIPHVQALGLVLDIERSLIERNVFQRFEGDSREVEQVLKILEDHQKIHVSTIIEHLQRVRATGAS